MLMVVGEIIFSSSSLNYKHPKDRGIIFFFHYCVHSIRATYQKMMHIKYLLNEWNAESLKALSPLRFAKLRVNIYSSLKNSKDSSKKCNKGLNSRYIFIFKYSYSFLLPFPLLSSPFPSFTPLSPHPCHSLYFPSFPFKKHFLQAINKSTMVPESPRTSWKGFRHSLAHTHSWFPASCSLALPSDSETP